MAWHRAACEDVTPHVAGPSSVEPDLSARMRMRTIGSDSAAPLALPLITGL